MQKVIARSIRNSGERSSRQVLTLSLILLLSLMQSLQAKAQDTYIFVNRALDFSSADQYCQQRFGTSLASATTVTQATEAAAKLNEIAPSSLAWLGYWRKSNGLAAQWLHVDGVSDFPAFPLNGSSNFVANRCTALRNITDAQGNTNAVLQDPQCTNRYRFLCWAPGAQPRVDNPLLADACEQLGTAHNDCQLAKEHSTSYSSEITNDLRANCPIISENFMTFSEAKTHCAQQGNACKGFRLEALHTAKSHENFKTSVSFLGDVPSLCNQQVAVSSNRNLEATFYKTPPLTPSMIVEVVPTAFTGDSVELNAQLTWPSDQAQTFLETQNHLLFQWEVLNHPEYIIDSSQNPSVYFIEPGDYEIRLTVTIEGKVEASASASITIKQSNRFPSAVAGVDQIVECTGVQTLVTLDGSASNDPDGDNLSYLWQGNNESADTAIWQPLLNSPGRHSIALQVSDGELSANDQINVEIVDTAAPSLSLPASIELTNASNEPLTLGADELITQLGDTLVVSDACDPQPTVAMTPNTFDFGTTSALVTVTDNQGQTTNGQINITVNAEGSDANDIAALRQKIKAIRAQRHLVVTTHRAAREIKIQRVNALKASIATAKQTGNRQKAKAIRSELRIYRQEWAIVREAHQQLRQEFKAEIQAYRDRIAEIRQQ